MAGPPASHVFIAGFPKCGTTSLFDWLALHPEVCASSEKETYYLADSPPPGGRSFKRGGMAGFMEYFDTGSKPSARVLLEGTPTHVYDKTALDALTALSPRPRVVLLVRRPSERVYSLYKQNRYKTGLIGEDVSFGDFVRASSGGGADAASLFGGREFLCEAVGQSLYADHVLRWGDALGRENIGVFLFEDLAEDAGACVREISAFMRIDGSFWEGHRFLRTNESVRIKRRRLHRAMRKLTGVALRQFIRRRVPAVKQAYFGLNAEVVPETGEDERRVMRELDEYFLPSISRLEEAVGKDLGRLKGEA